jgi:hypothetical protein
MDLTHARRSCHDLSPILVSGVPGFGPPVGYAYPYATVREPVRSLFEEISSNPIRDARVLSSVTRIN